MDVRRSRQEVVVGMLVVGTAEGLISGMRRQLESLLTFSSGDPLHLIVVTDYKSKSFVAEQLAGIVARWEAQVKIICKVNLKDLWPWL